MLFIWEINLTHETFCLVQNETRTHKVNQRLKFVCFLKMNVRICVVASSLVHSIRRTECFGSVRFCSVLIFVWPVYNIWMPHPHVVGLHPMLPYIRKFTFISIIIVCESKRKDGKRPDVENGKNEKKCGTHQQMVKVVCVCLYLNIYLFRADKTNSR